MDDIRIIALYWARSEQAILETAAKYGAYLQAIAQNVLNDREDAAECVSDTYHQAWNAMPPHRPQVLSAFLGKITRRLSIDCWRRRTAEKRGGGETALALEELSDCVSGSGNVEDEVLRRAAVQAVNDFLAQLPVTERRVFLRRYWYLESVPEIAAQFGFSAAKVTSMLHRTRLKLRELLEKEGYA